MTWKDIRDRKEDSIRESTGNPMTKSFEVNGKIYNSYTEYSNTDEHKELLKAEEESQELYVQLKTAQQALDEAKKQGAFWDKDTKKWQFIFNLEEFLVDEDQHTFQFKPYAINLVGCNEYLKEKTHLRSHQLIDKLYNIAKNRTIKYMTQKEPPRLNFQILNEDGSIDCVRKYQTLQLK